MPGYYGGNDYLFDPIMEFFRQIEEWIPGVFGEVLRWLIEIPEARESDIAHIGDVRGRAGDCLSDYLENLCKPGGAIYEKYGGDGAPQAFSDQDQAHLDQVKQGVDTQYAKCKVAYGSSASVEMAKFMAATDIYMFGQACYSAIMTAASFPPFTLALAGPEIGGAAAATPILIKQAMKKLLERLLGEDAVKKLGADGLKAIAKHPVSVGGRVALAPVKAVTETGRGLWNLGRFGKDELGELVPRLKSALPKVGEHLPSAEAIGNFIREEVADKLGDGLRYAGDGLRYAAEHPARLLDRGRQAAGTGARASWRGMKAAGRAGRDAATYAGKSGWDAAKYTARGLKPNELAARHAANHAAERTAGRTAAKDVLENGGSVKDAIRASMREQSENAAARAEARATAREEFLREYADRGVLGRARMLGREFVGALERVDPAQNTGAHGLVGKAVQRVENKIGYKVAPGDVLQKAKNFAGFTLKTNGVFTAYQMLTGHISVGDGVVQIVEQTGSAFITGGLSAPLSFGRHGLLPEVAGMTGGQVAYDAAHFAMSGHTLDDGTKGSWGDFFGRERESAVHAAAYGAMGGAGHMRMRAEEYAAARDTAVGRPTGTPGRAGRPSATPQSRPAGTTRTTQTGDRSRTRVTAVGDGDQKTPQPPPAESGPPAEGQPATGGEQPPTPPGRQPTPPDPHTPPQQRPAPERAAEAPDEGAVPPDPTAAPPPEGDRTGAVPPGQDAGTGEHQSAGPEHPKGQQHPGAREPDKQQGSEQPGTGEKRDTGQPDAQHQGPQGDEHDADRSEQGTEHRSSDDRSQRRVRLGSGGEHRRGDDPPAGSGPRYEAGLTLNEGCGVPLGERRSPEELYADLAAATEMPTGELPGSLFGDIEHRDGFLVVRQAGDADPRRVMVTFGELPDGMRALSTAGAFRHLGEPVDVVVLSDRLVDRVSVGEALHHQLGALTAGRDGGLARLRRGLTDREAGEVQRRWFLSEQRRRIDADLDDPARREEARAALRDVIARQRALESRLGMHPDDPDGARMRAKVQRFLRNRPMARIDPDTAAERSVTASPGGESPGSDRYRPDGATKPLRHRGDVLVSAAEHWTGSPRTADEVYADAIAGAGAFRGEPGTDPFTAVRHRDGFLEFERPGDAQPVRLRVVAAELPEGVVAVPMPDRVPHADGPAHLVLVSHRLPDQVAAGEAVHRVAAGLARGEQHIADQTRMALRRPEARALDPDNVQPGHAIRLTAADHRDDVQRLRYLAGRAGEPGEDGGAARTRLAAELDRMRLLPWHPGGDAKWAAVSHEVGATARGVIARERDLAVDRARVQAALYTTLNNSAGFDHVEITPERADIYRVVFDKDFRKDHGDRNPWIIEVAADERAGGAPLDPTTQVPDGVVIRHADGVLLVRRADRTYRLLYDPAARPGEVVHSARQAMRSMVEIERHNPPEYESLRRTRRRAPLDAGLSGGAGSGLAHWAGHANSYGDGLVAGYATSRMVYGMRVHTLGARRAETERSQTAWDEEHRTVVTKERLDTGFAALTARARQITERLAPKAWEDPPEAGAAEHAADAGADQKAGTPAEAEKPPVAPGDAGEHPRADEAGGRPDDATARDEASRPERPRHDPFAPIDDTERADLVSAVKESIGRQREAGFDGFASLDERTRRFGRAQYGEARFHLEGTVGDEAPKVRHLVRHPLDAGKDGWLERWRATRAMRRTWYGIDLHIDARRLEEGQHLEIRLVTPDRPDHFQLSVSPSFRELSPEERDQVLSAALKDLADAERKSHGKDLNAVGAVLRGLTRGPGNRGSKTGITDGVESSVTSGELPTGRSHADAVAHADEKFDGAEETVLFSAADAALDGMRRRFGALKAYQRAANDYFGDTDPYGGGMPGGVRREYTGQLHRTLEAITEGSEQLTRTIIVDDLHGQLPPDDRVRFSEFEEHDGVRAVLTDAFGDKAVDERTHPLRIPALDRKEPDAGGRGAESPADGEAKTASDDGGGGPSEGGDQAAEATGGGKRTVPALRVTDGRIKVDVYVETGERAMIIPVGKRGVRVVLAHRVDKDGAVTIDREDATQQIVRAVEKTIHRVQINHQPLRLHLLRRVPDYSFYAAGSGSIAFETGREDSALITLGQAVGFRPARAGFDWRQANSRQANRSEMWYPGGELGHLTPAGMRDDFAAADRGLHAAEQANLELLRAVAHHPMAEQADRDMLAAAESAARDPYAEQARRLAEDLQRLGVDGPATLERRGAGLFVVKFPEDDNPLPSPVDRTDFLNVRTLVVPKEMLGGAAAASERFFYDEVHAAVLVSDDPAVSHGTKLRAVQAELQKLAYEQQDRPDPASYGTYLKDAVWLRGSSLVTQTGYTLLLGGSHLATVGGVAVGTALWAPARAAAMDVAARETIRNKVEIAQMRTRLTKDPSPEHIEVGRQIADGFLDRMQNQIQAREAAMARWARLEAAAGRTGAAADGPRQVPKPAEPEPGPEPEPEPGGFVRSVRDKAAGVLGRVRGSGADQTVVAGHNDARLAEQRSSHRIDLTPRGRHARTPDAAAPDRILAGLDLHHPRAIPKQSTPPPAEGGPTPGDR